jgi:hypothetical protein
VYSIGVHLFFPVNEYGTQVTVTFVPLLDTNEFNGLVKLYADAGETKWQDLRNRPLVSPGIGQGSDLTRNG